VGIKENGGEDFFFINQQSSVIQVFWILKIVLFSNKMCHCLD